MTIKIRLARAGAKKRPYYKIVVANADSPRDGKFLEKVGVYNPMLAKEDENRVVLIQDRIKHWVSVGAQPTERVEKFLEKAKLIKTKSPVKRVVKKVSVKEKSQDSAINETSKAVEVKQNKVSEESKKT
jgi:small subunit ribosomal protein S16